MADAETEFQDKFEALRQSYVARLGERLGAIEAAADELATASDTAAMETIKAETHKLAGNAPTFGFKALGQAALEIEHECEALLDGGGVPAEEERARISAMVRDLRGLAVEAGG